MWTRPWWTWISSSRRTSPRVQCEKSSRLNDKESKNCTARSSLEKQRQRRNDDYVEYVGTVAASAKANNRLGGEDNAEARRINKIDTGETGGDAAKEDAVVALPECNDDDSTDERQVTATNGGDVRVKKVEVAAMGAQRGIVVLDDKLQRIESNEVATPGTSCVVEKSVSSGMASESCESKRHGVSGCSDDKDPREKAKTQQNSAQSSSVQGGVIAEVNILGRKAAVTPRSKRQMCRYSSCVEWSQGGGLCYAHGGYKIKRCKKKTLTRRICIQCVAQTKCIKNDCEKYSVPGSQRFCVQHAREHERVVKSGKKCGIDGCEMFAVARGHGYCRRHAREHGNAVNNDKKCGMDGCESIAVARGHEHAREHGIVVDKDKKCGMDGCETFAVARGRGYCRRHAREHGIVVNNNKKCGMDGCEKVAVSHGCGYCRRHAREHGIVIRNGKRCSIEDCKTFTVAHGRGYCCRHARVHGIVVRNGKKCSIGGCEKFAVARGRGYCRRHARENGIIVVRNDKTCSIEDCKTFAVANGRGYCCKHACEHGIVVRNGKRCSIQDCKTFAVSNGHGYCSRHARENSIVVRNGKKCSIEDCKTFSVSGGGGYCCKHAREHGIVVKNGKKCDTSGCDKMAVRNGHGFCYKHARENGITAEKAKQCSVGDCESLMVFHGYCHKHAGEQGITIKGICKFDGCQNLRKDQSYCENHQSYGAENISGNQEVQLNLCEKKSPLIPVAPACAHEDSSFSQSGSNTKTIKRRGPHVTCKVIGCMKWVKRDGDPSEYCIKHRTLQEPVGVSLVCSENRRVPGSKMGYCFRHGGGVTCNQPGCTKQRQRHGLCASHGGYYECIIEGCKKRAALGGCCRVHFRELNESRSTVV